MKRRQIIMVMAVMLVCLGAAAAVYGRACDIDKAKCVKRECNDMGVLGGAGRIEGCTGTQSMPCTGTCRRCRLGTTNTEMCIPGLVTEKCRTDTGAHFQCGQTAVYNCSGTFPLCSCRGTFIMNSTDACTQWSCVILE